MYRYLWRMKRNPIKIVMKITPYLITGSNNGALVAQWVKFWCLGSSLVRGENLLQYKWGSIAYSFHYHPSSILALQILLEKI